MQFLLRLLLKKTLDGTKLHFFSHKVVSRRNKKQHLGV